jgi:hypothetical protein
MHRHYISEKLKPYLKPETRPVYLPINAFFLAKHPELCRRVSDNLGRFDTHARPSLLYEAFERLKLLG